MNMLQEGDLCPNCGGTLERISLHEAECESCGSIVQVRYHTPFVEKTVPKPEPVLETTQTANDGEKKLPPVTSKQTVVKNYKSAGLAVVLGFFFSGLGYAYAGKTGAGIALFIFSIIFSWLAIAVWPFFIIIVIIIWLSGMVKGYKLASENNRLWAEYNS